MATPKKVWLLSTLLYTYAVVYSVLFILSLASISLDEGMWRTLFNSLIHLLIILGIAYFLPRKRSKSMYWVATALILFELVRKIIGIGLLFWLKQSGLISAALSPTSMMIAIAAIYAFVFAIAAILILQKDVRSALSTPSDDDTQKHGAVNTNHY